jgi:Asp-tRNA(Asn)/Glu-tRNA(Gln) amidotransferase A subunit family amidase
LADSESFLSEIDPPRVNTISWSIEASMDLRDDWRTGLTRRRFLEAAAIAAPAAFLSQAATTQSELLELGARAAVERIGRGELKAEEYAAELLDQYDAHKDLNLVTSIDRARVLEAARAIDRARARGARLGPAAGLLFAVKDQIEVAGYPATGGNRALEGYVPKRNAQVVERLVAAGAIPFCMTTLPDMTVIDGLMHQASPHSDSFGTVRNPYDPTHIPGGSSGGSGAILAARIVPAALGADANGSIRCPSAFCGVTGLRPSTFTIENALRGTKRKRYSDEGLLPPPTGRLYTIGPMARTAADVAFLDALITGQPVPAVDLRTVRIAVPRPDYWERDVVDPGVAAVVQQAFAKLRDAGCRLVEIDLNGEVRSIVGTFENPAPAARIAALGLQAPMSSRETMAQWLRVHAPDVTVEMMHRGRPMLDPSSPTLPPVDAQIKILTDASRRYAEVYRARRVAAIAFPTIPIVAMPIRQGGPKEPFGETIMLNGHQVEEGKALMRNLFIAPRLGAPALSVPVGLSRGLPVGLELDAMPGHDSELLGLGMAVQKVVGRIPPPTFQRIE